MYKDKEHPWAFNFLNFEKFIVSWGSNRVVVEYQSLPPGVSPLMIRPFAFPRREAEGFRVQITKVRSSMIFPIFFMPFPDDERALFRRVAEDDICSTERFGISIKCW
jgi:hypothetical protein